MEDKLIWMWVAIGFVPYTVALNWQDRGRWCLEVKALFWAFKISRRRNGRKDWMLLLPVIGKMRDAIWSAVMRLRDLPRDGEPPTGE
jgi:hypothetical protein